MGEQDLSPQTEGSSGHGAPRIAQFPKMQRFAGGRCNRQRTVGLPPLRVRQAISAGGAQSRSGSDRQARSASPSVTETSRSAAESER